MIVDIDGVGTHVVYEVPDGTLEMRTACGIAVPESARVTNASLACEVCSELDQIKIETQGPIRGHNFHRSQGNSNGLIAPGCA